MYSLFALPNEVLVSALLGELPCREAQIRALGALVAPRAPSPRNIVLYGLAATGKSAVTKAVLEALAQGPDSEEGTTDDVDGDMEGPRLRYAIVKSAECITGRHLLERTIAAVADAVGWTGALGRCENLAQLGVVLGKLLEGVREGGASRDKFVLVFDGIDAQRDAPPTLLPALARMGEVIPDLTTIFIVTSPRPHFLHNPGAPHINFPSYTKAEALAILALSPPPIYPSKTTNANDTDMDVDSEADDSHLHPTSKETLDLYTRFLSAIWDTFAKHSGRDLLSFRHLAHTLWPRFTLPIREGTHSAKGFQKLLLAQRGLFRDETLLVPSIVSIPPPSASSAQAQPANATPSKLATRSTQITLAKPIQIVTPPLPYTSRILLVAAYLASYTPARLDTVLFSKSSALAKKRRKGLAGTAVKSRPGVEKRRKINRTLLGPQAFVVERLLAIFSAVRAEAGAERRAWGGGERGRGMGMGAAEQMQGGAADVLSAIATLASLRLLVKTSAGADVLEGSAKWKVNVGWEVVRGVGRSVGIEVGEWVVE